jgi:hypothetical protein
MSVGLFWANITGVLPWPESFMVIGSLIFPVSAKGKLWKLGLCGFANNWVFTAVAVGVAVIVSVGVAVAVAVAVRATVEVAVDVTVTVKVGVGVEV